MTYSGETALASASRLPGDVQLRLWRSGSVQVRRVLAARSDLDVRVQRLAVCDPDETVRRAWAQTPRRSRTLLRKLLAGPVSDSLLQAVASQAALDGSMVEHLLARGSESVYALLLLRTDLTPGQRVHAAAGYSAARVRVGWSDAQTLVNHLSTDTDEWVAAVVAAPRGSSAAALAAASAAGADPRVQDAITTWWETYGTGRGDDERRDTSRARGDLARQWTLPPAVAARLAALPVNDPFTDVFHRRATYDLPAVVAAAEDGQVTPDGLTVAVAATSDGVGLPVVPLLIAASDYDDAAEIAGTVKILTRHLYPADAAAVLESLLDRGRVDQAVALLAEQSSLVCLEELRDPVPLLEALAARGSRDLLRSRLAASHADTVAARFAPLCDALVVPEVAAVAVAAAWALPAADAETALVLMPTWQGTLADLLASATALVAARRS